MKKILAFISAALLILSICIDANAYSKITDLNGDFQVWNTNDEEMAIGKATKFVMQEEYRYGNGGGDIFYQHYDWGFLWAFDKALDLQTGYRLVLEKVKGKWMEADEPYWMATAKMDIWKLKLDDRNRFEYRHFRYADDQVRYRNRITVKYPIDFKKIVIAPYISNEVFVSSNATGYNQNRVESGLEFGLTKYVKTSISYMQQQLRARDEKWFKANCLWLKLKIAF